MSASFVGFRFPPDVILLAVRWYLRYSLSYRDIRARAIIYDGALRGLHHQTFLRHLGLLTVSRVAAARRIRNKTSKAVRPTRSSTSKPNESRHQQAPSI